MQMAAPAAVAAQAATASAVPAPAVSPPTILFLCTANRCRSPLAQQLLHRALHEAGVVALVTSAGLMQGGLPTPRTGVRVAAANGLNLTKHHSVRVTPRLVQVSDVVLTMNRQHAREIVSLCPDSWPRVYPLKQFTELLQYTELPRRMYFRDAAVLVGEGRKKNAILGNPDYDSVEDPIGQPPAAWQRVLDELHQEISQIVLSFTTILQRSDR